MNDMTETKKPAGELATKTFKLFAPIYDGEKKITELTLTEPLVRQQVMAERDGKGSGMEIKSLIVQISNVKSKKAVDGLKLRDVGQVKTWLRAINKEAREADGLVLPVMQSEQVEEDPFADEPAAADDFEMEPERIFKLNVPIKYEGRTISELKAVEPDINAASAASKFDEETAATSAIIAVITGETIPIISRMAYRDLHRIEVWLIPFVQYLQMEVAG